MKKKVVFEKLSPERVIEILAETPVEDESIIPDWQKRTRVVLSDDGVFLVAGNPPLEEPQKPVQLRLKIC